MVPVRHRVASVRRDLPDTVTVALVPVEAPLPAFGPGQFNMLWSFGGGEVPISISGGPSPDGAIEHTIRSVGAATAALCSLRPGDVVGVRGPFGTRWELDPALGGDVVVVAGGIGLAPLRPVVLAALGERAAFGRVAVLVGARDPGGLLYRDELQAWRARGDVEVRLTVDHADPTWTEEVGVVTKLLDQATFDPAVTTAFVCGPEVMMRFAAASLAERGVAPAAIQVSLERNMRCAIAHCGHCQLGPTLICRDGPVYRYDTAGPLMALRGR